MSTKERGNGFKPEPPPRGPTCKEIVELVTAYFEDALSPGDRRAFEWHVGVCPECQIYLDQMRETVERLGELREESLTDRQRDELLNAFRGWRAGSG